MFKAKNLVNDFNEKTKEFTAKRTNNILSYAGKFKDKALKNKNIDEIIKIENEAIVNLVIRKYTKDIK